MLTYVLLNGSGVSARVSMTIKERHRAATTYSLPRVAAGSAYLLNADETAVLATIQARTGE